MSLQTHRIKIRNRVRKEQIKDFINKSRSEVIGLTKKNFEDEHSQNIMIDSLQKAVSESLKIDGEAIFQYIQGFKGEFSYRFRNEFTQLVLMCFRTSEVCLISLGYLIDKCKEIEVLNDLYIKDAIEMLFKDSWSQQNGKFINMEAIVWIVYNLLKKSKNTDCFNNIHKYQSQIQALGYGNVTYIKFIELAVANNIYLPSEACIEHYLKHDQGQHIDYQSYFSGVCSVLIAYYTLMSFGHSFLAWLNRRLNQDLFPDYLLDKLLSLILWSLEEGRISSQVLNAFIDTCFDGLCLVAMKRAFHVRVQTFKVLCQLLGQINDTRKSCELIDKNNMLELVASLLNLNVDNQMTFTLLVLLIQILKNDHRYKQQAEELGLLPILNFYQNSTNVRIADISQLIIHTFEFL